MTNVRIERLTREALGPARRTHYTRLDDALLRAVGIVALVVIVITFASWPRDDRASAPRTAASPARVSDATIVPAAHRVPPNGNAVRTADYTPLY